MSKGTYDVAVKDAQTAHADAKAAHDDAARCHIDDTAKQAGLDQLNASIAMLKAQMDDQTRALTTADGNAHALQAKIDGAIAENDQLRKELGRLGKNADALLAEKGSLASALADAKARLEELRKAQAAADARAALFKQLALKFQKMIDAGELKVGLRNGRMVLQLPNDVLFDSGRTDIKPAGKATLTNVAAVLRTINDRKFQIAGDTDNVPINTPYFPSNWELSTRRAVEVVRFSRRSGDDLRAALRRRLWRVRPDRLQCEPRGPRQEPSDRDHPSTEHRRAGVRPERWLIRPPPRSRRRSWP